MNNYLVMNCSLFVKFSSQTRKIIHSCRNRLKQGGIIIKKRKGLTIIALIVIFTFNSLFYLPAAYAAKSLPVVNRTLKPGTQGEDVKAIQTLLKRQGFFKDKITGHYGPATKEAVSRFQKAKGLPVDGAVGRKTAAALMAKSPVSKRVSRGGSRPSRSSNISYIVREGDSLWLLAAKYRTTVDKLKEINNITSDALSLNQELLIPTANAPEANAHITSAPEANAESTPAPSSPEPSRHETVITPAPASPEVAGAVYGEYADWWGDARYAFPIGSRATVIDVDTGLKFLIKRSYGVNHADCEPLTADDAAVMRRLYPRWSWDTRAIVVEVNGRRLAASMSGMPHSIETIGGENDFDGHFDIHFLNSRSHNTNSIRPEHQDMVRKAARR